LLADPRAAGILEAVREEGAARTNQLAVKFGVSEMTIRRDTAALSNANLLRRVRGGVVVGIRRSSRYSPATNV
jgi:DeoR/GlpR family transcriptional regulator of sugar metabolism